MPIAACEMPGEPHGPTPGVVCSQQAGTPCKPMLVMMQCVEDMPCKGIGDRVKSLDTAFWMVPPCLPILGPDANS